MSEVSAEAVAAYKAAFRSVFDKWLNDGTNIPDKEIGNVATKHALGVVFAAKETGLAKLREALQECEAYFDNRADADCDQDGYIPNEEMKLLTIVRDALRKAGA
ncbi:hypothetical protein ACLMJV_20990 [Sinorhizobium meliloti]|uniref:hypothetical protein n=1 Tax=Rhizobium meliloti TaxID=382 RepID=UPI00398D27FB